MGCDLQPAVFHWLKQSDMLLPLLVPADSWIVVDSEKSVDAVGGTRR